jgi:O-antigen/teichoic acid export membrane protein
MTHRVSALRRLLAFALTTGVASVATVVAIPIIISGAGEYAWGVQASIQSAAGLFGVLVAFGWGTTGAGEVAAMSVHDRPQWYADSLVSRAYLFVCVYPLMVVVMTLLNPNFPALVAVGSAAYLVGFLGASWYFVGEARPGRLFLFDVMPQTLGLIFSIGVMLRTQSLVATVTTQLIFNVIGPAASAGVILHGSRRDIRFDWSPLAAFKRLGNQRHAVYTSATAGIYVSAPLLVLNVVNPSSMALYAMGDKLFRFALTVFSPVLQFVQGWLSEAGRAQLSHRVIVAMRLVPVVSAVGGVTIFALGPWTATFLSRGVIDFGHGLAAAFGVVLFAVSLTQVLGLACLVQLGRSRDLARSTLCGALVGLPLLVVGATLFSVEGVAWALSISEIIVLTYQAVVIFRVLRTPGE